MAMRITKYIAFPKGPYAVFSGRGVTGISVTGCVSNTYAQPIPNSKLAKTGIKYTISALNFSVKALTLNY
jgi:hypothetical protein